MIFTWHLSTTAANSLSAYGILRMVMPECIIAFRKAHPDIQIYVGHLDRCLNENAYICPGLGDAGDRIFGTK